MQMLSSEFHPRTTIFSPDCSFSLHRRIFLSTFFLWKITQSSPLFEVENENIAKHQRSSLSFFFFLFFVNQSGWIAKNYSVPLVSLAFHHLVGTARTFWEKRGKLKVSLAELLLASIAFPFVGRKRSGRDTKMPRNDCIEHKSVLMRRTRKSN